MITRRSILRGALALLAAPAIVKVSSLMPISAMRLDPLDCFDEEAALAAMRKMADRVINPPLVVSDWRYLVDVCNSVVRTPAVEWFSLAPGALNVSHGCKVLS